jgi:PAS domain S-box-containing protein
MSGMEARVAVVGSMVRGRNGHVWEETEVSLRRQIERLKALNSVAGRLASERDLERIVQVASDGAAELCRAAFAAFFCKARDAKTAPLGATGAPKVYARSAAAREAFAALGTARTAALIESVLRGGRILRSDDVGTDPRLALGPPQAGGLVDGLPVVSCLVVPVVSPSGEIHGGLVCGHDAPGVFTADSEEIVAAIAAHAAIAIDNARLLQAAQEGRQTAAREHARAEELQAMIIERKHAEEALRAKDAELELIMRRTPFMMTRYGVDLRCRFASPAYARMLGRTPEDIVGEPLMRVVGESAFNTILPHVRRVLTGERVEWECQLDFPGVGLRHIHGVYLPEQDVRDNVTGWIASLLDVSDRSRAEQVARQLAAIVASSDDAIVSKDLDSTVMSWNDAAERIFGYSAQEMIGRSITTIIPSDLQDEEPRILERIRHGERVDHYETVRRRKDGSLIDVSLTISPLKDSQGGIVGASKIAHDITDRKRAEAALRDSERRLQDLLAAIPAAIYTTDADGTLTYFNQAAVEFSGREPVIGVDKWCVSFKLFRPDGTPLPHDQCPMAIALKEGRIVRGVEAVAERPDGSRVPFIPHPTPLHDASGRVVGAINMLVDISERKQSETHQRVLLRELNHRVKNNMQILHVLLSTSLRGTRSPEARSVIEDASRRVGAMAAAQQVLYGTPDGTSFSAAEFLQTVCRTAQQTFAKSVAIEIVAAEGSLSNDTAAPLALILNELLTNAVKHGLAGRGGAVRTGLRREADGYVLFVEDDGPGFEIRAAPRQASGLALVQALARQLRGHLEVSRAPRTRCSLIFRETGQADG